MGREREIETRVVNKEECQSFALSFPFYVAFYVIWYLLLEVYSLHLSIGISRKLLLEVYLMICISEYRIAKPIMKDFRFNDGEKQ